MSIKQQLASRSRQVVSALVVGSLIFMLATLSVSVAPAQADVSGPSAPTQKMFLKLDGVFGDSTDVGHNGEFDITSVSWESSQVGALKGGGGGGVQKVAYGDVSVYIKSGAASADLLQLLANGKRMKNALVTIETARGPIISLKLTDAQISGYGMAGANTDAVPSDHLTLTFKKLTLDYVNPNGILANTTVSK